MTSAWRRLKQEREPYHGRYKPKDKTGFVVGKHGMSDPLRVVSQEKRRQIALSPFFFACFLLDFAAILY
jgi:hypothetical protein